MATWFNDYLFLVLDMIGLKMAPVVREGERRGKVWGSETEIENEKENDKKRWVGGNRENN